MQSRKNRSSVRLKRSTIAVQLVLVIWVLIASIPAGRVTAAAADEDRPLEEALLRKEKRLGDFDEMVKQRTIRALVVYSKTFYFLDRGRQRGITYELLKEFEKFVNNELKTKKLKIHVVIIPVRRDELIPGLVEGFGDIAAANLTITPERQKQVDFSNPLLSGVKELLVTGPAAPPLASLDDLAGTEIVQAG